VRDVYAGVHARRFQGVSQLLQLLRSLLVAHNHVYYLVNTTMMLLFYSVPSLKDFKGVQNSGRGGLDVELIGIAGASELARFPYFVHGIH
jgi:hypothetical protein